MTTRTRAGKSAALLLASAGFTLLEAIVALVIFSTAGLALFSWINQNLQVLARAQDVSEATRAKRNVLEFMSDINPMQRGAGSNDFGIYKITWHSAEKIAPRDNSGYPAGTGSFSVALYRTSIDVTRASGARWFSFELTQAGYRRLGEPTHPLGAPERG